MSIDGALDGLRRRAMQLRRHIGELQTLRGVAALVVAVSHISTIYSLPDAVRVGIDVVLNAHAAIVVFFVLSGYVLTGALIRRGITMPAVTAFYISRVFRLFPAMWFVSGLSAASLLLAPSLDIRPATSAWFLEYLHPFPDFRRVALSLVAVDNSLIMPIWTVFIELIGSALMPAFVAVAVWKPRLLPWLVLLLGTLAYPLAYAPHRINAFGFMFEFSIGVLIATDRFKVSFRWPLATMLVASAALLFFRASWFACLNGHLMPLTVGYGDPIPMIVEGIAAGGLISALANGDGRFRLLNNPWSVWLGDISYSLYLVHFPVGLLLAKVLSDSLLALVRPEFAMFILLSTSIAITAIISHLIFHFIEIPSNEFGKRFSYIIADKIAA